MMRRLMVAVAAMTAVCGMSLLGAAPAVAAASAPVTTRSGMTYIRTTVSGAEAVPTGDPEGTGFADFVFGPGDRVCFRVVVSGIAPITGVHIHEAPRGFQGPHAIDLDAPIVRFSDGTQVFRGCVSGEGRIGDVLANPAGFYVNVHTHEFPLGAARGQLG